MLLKHLRDTHKPCIAIFPQGEIVPYENSEFRQQCLKFAVCVRCCQVTFTYLLGDTNRVFKVSETFKREGFTIVTPSMPVQGFEPRSPESTMPHDLLYHIGSETSHLS